jgi:hypothetical protein
LSTEQVTADATPDPAAVATVAQELADFDRPPTERLAELMGEPVQADDPVQALDVMLAEPEAPEPVAVPELTSEAFAELSPGVSEIWQAVHGEDVADRVQDARRGLGALAADEASLAFVDGLADLGGVRLEVALWDALAVAGKRLVWNGAVGGPISGSRIEAFEAAPTRQAIEEAEADGLLPKGSVGEWMNGRLGNAVSTIMNARRGAAHLMRTMPELARAGVDLGLHRNPDVWRRLAELGQQVGRGGPSSKKDTSMTAASSDKVEAIKDKLRELQNDPRYWRDRDPAIIKQVERGWTAVSPGIHQSGDSVSQAQSPIARGLGR